MSSSATRSDAERILRLQWQAAQRGALNFWTIYDRPKDHPEGFIARRFEAAGDEPVPTSDTLAGELEELRAAFEKAGLVKMPRAPQDEQQIVETWL